ncbi:hypothetical protein ACJJTC_003315 [Scirpophaga incertulas]
MRRVLQTCYCARGSQRAHATDHVRYKKKLIPTPTLPLKKKIVTDDFNLTIDNDHDYLADPSRSYLYTEHIIPYIGGFIVKKLLKSLKCEECLLALVSTKFPGLISFKDKGGLVYPSGDVINICLSAEKIFKKEILRGLSFFAEKNIVIKLIKPILKSCYSIFMSDHFKNQPLHRLTHATQMKLREKGKVEASRIVKDLTKSPRRARKYAAAMKSTLEEEQDKIMKLKHLRALFMYTEAGLTQAQYEIVRDTNPSFYPCYTILQKLKKECYPTIHRVTETCAEVTVQNLMDHTAQRLILHLGEGAVEQLTELEKQSLILISKWGCDGSQQMTYKMKFENEADSDANIFQTSMVPLQLVYGQDKKILWQNPVPSSPRYCRPIRIRFVKETIDIINEEIDYIKSQVASLNESEVQGLSVKHKMLFTMVDGKVCLVVKRSAGYMTAPIRACDWCASRCLPRTPRLRSVRSQLHLRA